MCSWTVIVKPAWPVSRNERCVTPIARRPRWQSGSSASNASLLSFSGSNPVTSVGTAHGSVSGSVDGNNWAPVVYYVGAANVRCSAHLTVDAVH